MSKMKHYAIYFETNKATMSHGQVRIVLGKSGLKATLKTIKECYEGFNIQVSDVGFNLISLEKL
jgi:hypothetical protein